MHLDLTAGPFASTRPRTLALEAAAEAAEAVAAAMVVAAMAAQLMEALPCRELRTAPRSSHTGCSPSTDSRTVVDTPRRSQRSALPSSRVRDDRKNRTDDRKRCLY